MPAPKGHKLYNFDVEKFRNPKKFTSIDDVNETWCKYLEWCESNPVTRTESHIKQGTIDIQVPRPLLKEDFCLFAGITMQTFDNYKMRKGYETFFEIFTHIEHAIFSQNYTLAVANVHNSTLAARKLGIADSKKIDATVKAPEIKVKDAATADEVNRIIDGDN